MSAAYLIGILVSAIGVGLIDARWRLAVFHRPLRALFAVTATSLLLLVIGGIATGNFILGDSQWMTGIELLPHLPIEEIAFILFLSYVSLVAVSASSRALTTLGAKNREEEDA